LLTNIRLGWKWISVTNAPLYNCIWVITVVKIFTVQVPIVPRALWRPKAAVIKLFFAIES
jgi:hypothetical protein